MNKVTFINHSGYLLETEDTYFLFDYYNGELPEFDSKKAIVVFVSHRHEDHYNPEIFTLVKKYPQVQYVIAKGTPIKRHVITYEEQGIDLSAHILLIRKNTEEKIRLSNGKELTITALRSTDIGVAFLLSYEQKTYYHAGDLHLWLWDGEDKQFNENMAKKYDTEMEKLKGMSIDIAFVPLDGRQGKYVFAGLESFLECTRATCVFPMHMWGEFGVIEEFLKAHPTYSDRIMRVENPGQEWSIP